MEEVLQAIGIIGLVLLAAIGVAAGLLASAVTGRNRARNVAIGVIGAVATPFVLALIGVGVLAAGGLIAILIVALVGAAAILLIARAIFD